MLSQGINWWDDLPPGGALCKVMDSAKSKDFVTVVVVKKTKYGFIDEQGVSWNVAYPVHPNAIARYTLRVK